MYPTEAEQTSSTTAGDLDPSTLEVSSTTPLPNGSDSKGEKHFPYPVVFMILIWAVLGVAYLYNRWRQKAKSIYIIPRVFVLCSPRTVQFHYELILRVGLPSYEFNPDKHDIDITVQGQQRNEVVPMTRLNTKTLNDEPLITSLSIVVYRLVEMPPIGSLVLRHSGPFRAWLYIYDFTVIDLSTNKEQYYTINKYVGSLNRVYQLNEDENPVNVHYPIDDVPLPHWSIEDVFIILITAINSIMVSVALLPINCSGGIKHDIGAIVLSTLCGGSVIFFLNWLIYFYVKWNQDRREYFNLTSSFCCGWESSIRLSIASLATLLGMSAVYFGFKITEWQDSLVWLLVTTDTSIIVVGLWNVARLAELDQSIVALGLRIRGIETVGVGMKYSEIVSDIQTKSNSTSDDGGGGSHMSAAASKFARFGPRSSVKSFGFDANKMTSHQRLLSKMVTQQRTSSTGATPDQRINAHSVHKRAY